MATIKRNGDKVVLKDGKVACSCCGPECCMYLSSDFQEEKITQYDLPDELFLKTGGVEILIPRVVEYYNGDISINVNYELIDIENPFPNPTDPLTSIFIGYEFGISSNWIIDISAFDNRGSIPCFGYKDIGISGPEDFFTIRAIYDNFSSSFSVSGPISGVVTRPEKWSKTDQEYVDEFLAYFNAGSIGPPPTPPQTICRWAGGGIVLKWNPLTARWNVNGFEKSGFQNTPVGSYAGGFTVS